MTLNSMSELVLLLRAATFLVSRCSSESVPPGELWIVRGQRIPLSIGHAIVGKTASSDTHLIAKGSLSRVENLVV